MGLEQSANIDVLCPSKQYTLVSLQSTIGFNWELEFVPQYQHCVTFQSDISLDEFVIGPHPQRLFLLPFNPHIGKARGTSSPPSHHW
jgi:hypothetical protein